MLLATSSVESRLPIFLFSFLPIQCVHQRALMRVWLLIKIYHLSLRECRKPPPLPCHSTSKHWNGKRSSLRNAVNFMVFGVEISQMLNIHHFFGDTVLMKNYFLIGTSLPLCHIFHFQPSRFTQSKLNSYVSARDYKCYHGPSLKLF